MIAANKIILLMTKLVLAFVAVGTLSSCNKLGLQTEAKQESIFLGITSLIKNADESYYITWDKPVSNQNDQIVYKIYSNVEKVEASGLNASDQTTSFQGNLQDIPDINAPVRKGSLMQTVVNENSLTVPYALTPGLRYSFQVRMVDTDGKMDSNQKVLSLEVPIPVRIKFEGLKSANARLSADKSKITLSWDAASDTAGQVTYAVYGDTTFAVPLASISETTWDFLNPQLGKSYTFAVRAKDSIGFDTNSSFVIVDVPDPRDHTPPSFAGVSAVETVSHRKIHLRWAPSTSSDISRYKIYDAFNLGTPIGSTDDVQFTVNNLSPATKYSFIVRAQDASGNEDENRVVKEARTLSYAVPDFAGIDSITSPSGIPGLTNLRLTWQPAGGIVSGYRIYAHGEGEDFDWNNPISDIANPNATTTLINGLNRGTAYSFVVRAYDSTSGTARSELNSIELTASTLTIRAPSFGGISSAAAGEGILGLSTLVLTWGTPASNGIYDSFRLSYEEGSCATGFSNSPSQITLSDPDMRTYSLSGLTSNRRYRMKIQAVYATENLIDTNNTCKDATTVPLAPVFNGVASANTAAGVQGFDSLTVTWPQAAGSFSYYKVEWSLSSNFAVIGGTTQITNRTTLTTTLTGLPTETLVFVRVSAYFDAGGIVLGSGGGKIISSPTTPIAPKGEGVTSVSIAAADALNVAWSAPNNSGALFNGYKMWYACSTNASVALNNKLSGAADRTYPISQTGDTLSGLTQDVDCCVTVRAFYSDASHNITSTSTEPMLCNAPKLNPPTFAGIKTLSVPNATVGFTQLNVGWEPVSSLESGLFSYYQVAYATTPNGQNWSTASQIATRTQTSTTISGLTPNTTYYFRVRAVNANGTPEASMGESIVLSAVTTPSSPNGDALSAAASIGSTKIQVSYKLPSATTGGLFNQVFLFVQAGTLTDTTNFRNSLETGGILNSEITGSMNAKKFTVTSLPALISVPLSELDPANTINNLEIFGLSANTQVCVQAAAVHWLNGQPEKYLRSTTASSKCATPNAGPPIFDGISAVAGFSDIRDFTQIKIDWGNIVGECTSVEISAIDTQNVPNFTTPIATAACSDRTKTLVGLTPHKTYYFQVRAVNSVAGTNYYGGMGVELSRKMVPPVPTGDGLNSASATSIPKAKDEIALSFSEATSGFFNKSYIWRAVGATQSTAEAAVRAAASTRIDNSGPIAAPYFVLNTGVATVTDTQAVAGQYTCFLSRSVYVDASYYSSSLADVVKCASPAYTPPVFSGVISGTVIGTWPDGTAKIQLVLNGIPSGSIEEFMIYYSPQSSLSSFGDLTAEPWQRFDMGDSTYDNNPYDNLLLVGAKNFTITGNGYYLVRYKFHGGVDTDTNTMISTAVNVPLDQANLAYVAPSVSGLSYGYYMMQYHAAVESGAFSNDTVATTEANISSCSYEFHVNKSVYDSTCGTHGSNLKVKSAPNLTPLTNIAWRGAFVGCRFSGGPGVMMRMPTEEEHDRAARWNLSSYSVLNTVYSAGTGTNCNSNTNVDLNSGVRSSCVSSQGIFDLAGNFKEWVDGRLVPYDIASNSQSRFGYGPMTSRILKNGIDNRSRRLELANTSTNSFFAMKGTHSGSALSKAYGPEVLLWQNALGNSKAGLRCVAFLSTKMPTMESMALPEEPVYAATDLPASPANWTIPENKYIGDTKPETVAITVTGNSSDEVAEGKVNISWKPWQKTVCNPVCTTSSSGISYKLYRFIEPTRMSLQGSNSGWALSGGTNNPYSVDKSLDPFSRDASGNLNYTESTTDGKIIATIANCDDSNLANCKFEDSATSGTGFSSDRLYYYLLTAIDSSGNAITSKVQRFRSLFLTNNPGSTDILAGSRMEPRFRRASVKLIDAAHQANQSRPQIMVHVPMDLSGLDHDFYIQKYEAAQYGATGPANDSPVGASAWPLQGTSTSWVTNSGACFNKFMQTATFDLASCGDGTAVNATDTSVQSKAGEQPLVNIDQGASWKSCRNTGVNDGSGSTYYLNLPSDTEWMKAADWGDVDMNGTVDQSVVTGNLGANVQALEFGTANNTTIRCHTDSDPANTLSSGNSSTANCRSRYGAADMIGNVWEWTSGQSFNGAGRDNGTDGLWYGVTFPASNASISTLKMDLTRAIPAPTGSTIFGSGDYYYAPSAGVKGTLRGAAFSGGDYAGRWLFRQDVLPSYTGTTHGFRCGL